MSTLYVDNLQPNLGSQVEIPQLKPLAGNVIQVATASSGVQTTLAPGSGEFNIVSLSFTPKSLNSIIRVAWSHGQTTRVSSGGTSSWLSCGVKIDGVNQQDLAIGALGYPETFSDQRYMPSKMGYVASWSGAKTIVQWANVGSVSSNWTINHQGHITCLEVMEIAQ